jgi:hypothetical protein
MYSWTAVGDRGTDRLLDGSELDWKAHATDTEATRMATENLIDSIYV